MNSSLFLLTIIGLFILGYLVYGRYLKKVLGIDYKKSTPSFTQYDGVDYVPAKNMFILLGHHFSSIAGAGPIIGPIIAYFYWGWIGVILWIILGSIFLGGVHDCVSLFVSVRQGGRSIGDITKDYISKRAGKIFLMFIWFSLNIVIAVFSSLCAETFVKQPQIILPTIGLIPIAILLGLWIYRWRRNTIFATIISLFLIVILIYNGGIYSAMFLDKITFNWWLIILLIYAYVASILPVNVLLQPRDYLSSFFLFFFIGIASLCIIFYPVEWYKITPINFRFFAPQGYTLIPLMFITVACGAISGFHSLVSSGTTSKQIASERHIIPIGYGGMLLEGILASLIVICMMFGLSQNISDLKNPLEVFSLAFARLVPFLGKYSSGFAILVVNAFIITTLDTATRINRLITQELLSIKNKYLATSIVILFSFFLSYNNNWKVLWPIFGASNQLIAALALLGMSCYLLKNKKKFLFTLLPSIFMFVITILALFLSLKEFIAERKFLLIIIDIILIGMVLFIILEIKNEHYGKKR